MGCALELISLFVLAVELVGAVPNPLHTNDDGVMGGGEVTCLVLAVAAPSLGVGLGRSAMEAAGTSGGGGGMSETYASHAAKERDGVRAMVIALNLRALHSTRGYVPFTTTTTPTP